MHNKTQPLSISYLKYCIVKRHIFAQTIQGAELYDRIKRFIEFDFGQKYYTVTNQQRIWIIKGIFKTIQKLQSNKFRSWWIKLFTAHKLFKFILSSSKQQKQMSFPVILEQIQTLICELSNYVSNKNQQKSKQKGIISRSLSKITRSISSKSLNKLFGRQQQKTNKQQNMDKLNKQRQQINQNGLQRLHINLLVQYGSYLQKMIHDRDQIQIFISQKKQLLLAQSLSKKIIISKNQIGTISTKQTSQQQSRYLQISHQRIRRMNQEIEKKKQQKEQIVWKIFNIFHRITKITDYYSKILPVLISFQSFYLSLINFLSQDIQMLYNPVVNLIKAKIKQLNQQFDISQNRGIWKNNYNCIKYDSSFSKIQGNNRNAKYNSVIIQKVNTIHTMIEELGIANQVVLFIFFGSFHNRVLFNKRKPSNFISINDSSFDHIYKIVRRNNQQKQKQKAKINKSLQSSIKSHSLNRSSFVNIKSSIKHNLINNNNLNVQNYSINKDKQITNNKITINETNKNGKSMNEMNAVKYKSLKLQQMHSQSIRLNSKMTIINRTNPEQKKDTIKNIS